MKITKEQGVQISIATLAAWIPVIPVLWFVVKPILVTAVSTAMASDIQGQIKQEVAPINSAFSILIKRDIKLLRKEIAGMEWRRDNDRSNWTATDADDLVDLKIDLEAAKAALAGLRKKPS